MKVATSLIAFGLAIGVISEPILVNRDLAAFQGIISDIDGQVDGLSSAIAAYNGGDGAAVQQASDDLVSTIRTGIQTANGQPQLTQSEALALTSPVQDLIDKVDSTIDALIAKKQLFVDNCLGPDIQTSLGEQHAASQDLATAISSKVPENLQEIARELSAGISNAIQRGIDEYADVQPCEGGPSSSAAPSSQEPTSEPTGTAEPTGEPTGEPTAEPTGEPTLAPTSGAVPYPTPAEPTSGSAYPTGGVTPPPSFPGAASGLHAPVVGVAAALVAVAAAL